MDKGGTRTSNNSGYTDEVSILFSFADGIDNNVDIYLVNNLHFKGLFEFKA
ncbi:MAG: hypothetical protein ACP5PQ_06035 [Thermoproteota archaeon]